MRIEKQRPGGTFAVVERDGTIIEGGFFTRAGANDCLDRLRGERLTIEHDSLHREIKSLRAGHPHLPDLRVRLAQLQQQIRAHRGWQHADPEEWSGSLDAEREVGHDGRCRCGAIVPCAERECSEPPGHEYLCAECIEREMGRPDPLDVAMERAFD